MEDVCVGYDCDFDYAVRGVSLAWSGLCLVWCDVVCVGLESVRDRKSVE